MAISHFKLKMLNKLNNWLKIKNHHYYLMMGLLLIVAIFLRLYKLGQIPFALYIDELAMMVDAKSLSLTGVDMHGKAFWQSMFLSYGDYKLPVYLWLATLSFKLFRISEFYLRLPSAVIGILTIVLTGILSQKIFNSANKKSLRQIISILVITFSPWAMLFSRTAFEGHVGQFFLGLAVLICFLALEIPVLFLLAGLSAGLAVYSYFSVRFVWPIIYLAFGILFVLFRKKETQTKNLLLIITFFVLGGIVFFLSLQPLYKSEYYQASNQFRYSTTSVLNLKDWPVESNILKEQAGNHFIDRFFYHRYVLMARQLAKNYADHFSLNYLFFQGDSNLRHGTGQHGLFLWPLILAFLWGLIILFKKNIKAFAFLLIWWIAAVLPAAVPMETPHALRSLNALIPLSIIIGFGLKEIIIAFTLSQKKSIKILVSSYFLLLIFSAFEFVTFYFQQYPYVSALSWQDHQKEFVQTLLAKQSQTEKIYLQAFTSEPYLGFLAYDENLKDFSQLDLSNNDLKQITNQIKITDIYPDNWENIFPFQARFIVAGEYKWLMNNQWLLEPDYLKQVEFIYNSLGEKAFAILIYER